MKWKISLTMSDTTNLERKAVLKKNCEIGSHSAIMPGVTVGENSIVGAFSFVNMDILENVIAFGVPIKVIRGLKNYE